MKFIITIILLIIIYGCTGSTKTKIIEIFDRNSQVELRLICKDTYGMFIPPEPPRLKERTIFVNGYTREHDEIFSVELPRFDINVSPEFGCDVKWSDDFEFFAIKTTDCILIYSKTGKELSRFCASSNDKISSVGWNRKKQLLAVLKSLENNGRYGYISNTVMVKVISVFPDKKLDIDVFLKETKPVTFIFNGLGFNCQEISPESNYFVYSTGINIDIFDLNKRIIINSIETKKELHGIWWINDDEFVLGFGVLSGEAEYIHYFISNGYIKNVTNSFKNWDSNDVYQNEWYNNIFKNINF